MMRSFDSVNTEPRIFDAEEGWYLRRCSGLLVNLRRVAGSPRRDDLVVKEIRDAKSSSIVLQSLHEPFGNCEKVLLCLEAAASQRNQSLSRASV